MTRALLLTSILTAALALALVGCGGESGDTGETSKAQAESVIDRDSLVLEMAGMDSLTVLAVLETSHTAIVRSTQMGAFVDGIDSVLNSNSHFWVYSVNGEMANEACNRRMTQAGDVIRWHYRRFGN